MAEWIGKQILKIFKQTNHILLIADWQLSLNSFTPYSLSLQHSQISLLKSESSNPSLLMLLPSEHLNYCLSSQWISPLPFLLPTYNLDKAAQMLFQTLDHLVSLLWAQLSNAITFQLESTPRFHSDHGAVPGFTLQAFWYLQPPAVSCVARCFIDWGLT